MEMKTNQQVLESGSDTARSRYALCVRNDGYLASLEVRKLYRIAVPEERDANLLRVVDESGEDYLYPAEFFITLDLPQNAQRALEAIA
jgi:hypothetical protein